MEISSIFDDLDKAPHEFDAFFNANIDSISNFFDLNQLEKYESGLLNKPLSLYETSHEFLFAEQSNSSNGSSSSSSSDSLLDNTNTHNNSPDSNSTNSEFNFLDEQQQAILALEIPAQQQPATNSVQPISFILPETVENGMKIKNEIILNFDQMDEAQLYAQYELLSKIDLGQQLNVITMSSNDTCIDLVNEDSKMSDDDEEDDSEEENDSEELSANASKTKNRKVKFYRLLDFLRD
jgi:hypothetical protein